jgi:hypothetical protein
MPRPTPEEKSGSVPQFDSRSLSDKLVNDLQWTDKFELRVGKLLSSVDSTCRRIRVNQTRSVPNPCLNRMCLSMRDAQTLEERAWIIYLHCVDAIPSRLLTTILEVAQEISANKPDRNDTPEEH